MDAPAITMDVRRVGEKTAVVDIKGEVTAAVSPCSCRPTKPPAAAPRAGWS